MVPDAQQETCVFELLVEDFCIDEEGADGTELVESAVHRVGDVGFRISCESLGYHDDHEGDSQSHWCNVYFETITWHRKGISSYRTRPEDEQRILAHIGTGAAWSSQALHELDWRDSPNCQLCGELDDDTTHVGWRCKKQHGEKAARRTSACCVLPCGVAAAAAHTKWNTWKHLFGTPTSTLSRSAKLPALQSLATSTCKEKCSDCWDCSTSRIRPTQSCRTPGGL
jgi:hypothetical protein